MTAPSFPRACRPHAPAPHFTVPADRRFRTALGRSVLAVLAACAFAGQAQMLRVMPAPPTAADPAAATALLARMSAQAGTNLTPAGTTPTGAWLLAPAEPLPDAQGFLAGLRSSRDVLWAQIDAPRAKARQRSSSAQTGPGEKLLVRLAPGAAPDWDSLLPRFAELAGGPLAVERQIGPVWVLRLFQRQSAEALQDTADRIATEPTVQYADAVLRRFQKAALPNDPRFGEQWSLTDPVSGVNGPGAWAIQKGSSGVTVAVVDTGILPHPDLAGRVLAGYDFISDPIYARDGDGRDPNPFDQGDWTVDGDCGGAAWASPSSWHGTFVAGLIAANTNNGIGIAGLDWAARILPVRVLGQCGGTDEDVFEGMLWASGVNIAGVPPNTHAAKVINLSLGGFGDCTNAIQQAVDDALAQGSVVVVAAGNSSEDATSFAPANCSGVITVGAHNRWGDRAYYSNFGPRIDLSAPAGDGDLDDAILSLFNDGTTVPGQPTYGSGIGTSFATPLVAGTVSLMFARNPLLTPGQVRALLQGTARPFVGTDPCHLGNLCGAGMLDAGLALASTPVGTQFAPPGTVPVIEYYSSTLDHYFITADPAEIAALDASAIGVFKRTGNLFFAYVDPARAPASARPVCRFYAGAEQLIDSHFFTASADECAFVQKTWPGIWSLENPAIFYIAVPDAGGQCASGTLPVYRFFNNRRDANHRYTVDLSVRRSMINRAWVPDGAGSGGAAFCSPI